MLIKKETNLYQRQMKQKQTSVKANGIHCRWKPVTIAELQALLSLSLYMGVVKKPSLAHYWSRSLPYKEYFAPSVMSRDRYAAILAMLHFNDNGNYIPVGEDGHDKLFKIQPVLDKLCQKFETLYYPAQKLSLDKGTCAFKGRLGFKVYNPNKPNKWGIRLF